MINKREMLSERELGHCSLEELNIIAGAVSEAKKDLRIYWEKIGAAIKSKLPESEPGSYEAY